MQNGDIKKIGLIVSGKYEALSLLRYITKRNKTKLGAFDFYNFRINGYDVSMIVSGRKMEKAANAAKLLIEKASPNLIISFGCGTALEHEIRVGDVVYGNSVTMLEDGVFEQYYVLSPLHPDIQRFIFNIVFGFNARVFAGTIVTANNEQTILHYDKIKFAHPVLDLNMLGIAQIVSYTHVPLLAFRGITHNLSKEKTESLHTLFDFIWHYDKKEVIGKLAGNPWLLLQLPTYLKQKMHASHHVASTIFSLLQVLSINTRIDHDDLEYSI